MKVFILCLVLLLTSITFGQVQPLYTSSAVNSVGAAWVDSASSASVSFRTRIGCGLLSFKTPPPVASSSYSFGTDTLAILVKGDGQYDNTYDLLYYNNVPVYVVVDTTQVNAVSLNPQWTFGWRNFKIQYGLYTPVVQDTTRTFKSVNQITN